MQASVYIATSLDGFIARANGDLDWLTAGESAGSSEDYGYQEFLQTVDILVMGRHTYEKALTFKAWPYGSKPVVVLSSQPVPIPPHLAASVAWLSGTPDEVMQRLAARGARHLYVDGGKTIQRFLAAGCIQQLIITRLPILLGSGIPLFGPLPHEIGLRHIATRQFANGFVQSQYEVAGAMPPHATQQQQENRP
jgi:dihydrofolate reductase